MLNIEMESLLCDEVLFDYPSSIIECDEEEEEDNMHLANDDSGRILMLHDQTEEEFAHAFEVILEKEVSYMPGPGYVEHLNSNPLIQKERAKAVCWFIKSQRRLGLSLGTLFNAANYLDRFMSKNKCQGWNSWMFELLSISCLSVAAKFNETITPQLSEFQADDLGHCFEWRLIQHMELALLKAIGWRLTPTTPFSYTDMLSWSLRPMNSTLSNKFIDCVSELLLNALLDYKLLEVRPFAIAMCVIRFVTEELLPGMNNIAVLQHFNRSCNTQDYQDEILKCNEMMMSMKQPIEDHCLSSPVNVLLTSVVDDQFNSCPGGGLSKFDASDLIKTVIQINSNDLNPSKRMKKEEHAFVDQHMESKDYNYLTETTIIT